MRRPLPFNCLCRSPLSPYLTTPVKRFGDYRLPETDDLEPIDTAYTFTLATDP